MMIQNMLEPLNLGSFINLIQKNVYLMSKVIYI